MTVKTTKTLARIVNQVPRNLSNQHESIKQALRLKNQPVPGIITWFDHVNTMENVNLNIAATCSQNSKTELLNTASLLHNPHNKMFIDTLNFTFMEGAKKGVTGKLLLNSGFEENGEVEILIEGDENLKQQNKNLREVLVQLKASLSN